MKVTTIANYLIKQLRDAGDPPNMGRLERLLYLAAARPGGAFGESIVKTEGGIQIPGLRTAFQGQTGFLSPLKYARDWQGIDQTPAISTEAKAAADAVLQEFGGKSTWDLNEAIIAGRAWFEAQSFAGNPPTIAKEAIARDFQAREVRSGAIA